jgi:hypothetical protein
MGQEPDHVFWLALSLTRKASYLILRNPEDEIGGFSPRIVCIPQIHLLSVSSFIVVLLVCLFLSVSSKRQTSKTTMNN